MGEKERVDVDTLSLPDELIEWIDHAPVYESSGQSGARTVYVDRDGGAYLKIAVSGSLVLASQMQTFFSKHKMSSPVLRYLSADRDYMITAPVKGEDGTSEKYLAEPDRLSEIFGRSLRLLHEVDIVDCPIKDRMSRLIRMAGSTPFVQTHLDDIAQYIGAVCADDSLAEILAMGGLLKEDVLIHGDYCLPNIILNNWAFEGFIDVADGGVGDRHYDLAWGLWTLNWNLKTPKYGQRFLDAYGWDRIDKDRLRICGLLAAMQ
jgi:kanamycin kinase